MSGPIEPNSTSPDPGDTRAIADDLVVDGLLRHLTTENEDTRRQRMQRVHDAIAEQAHSGLHTPHRTRLRTRWGRVLLTAAAAIIVISSLVMVGTPGESEAHAGVRGAIEALRQPGSRRYEVRLTGSDGERGKTGAVIDIDGSGRVVIRHDPPGADAWVVAGRDAQGPWAVDGAGLVTRDNVYRFYPPWSVDDREPIVDSIDTVLEQLLERYELELLDPEPLENGGRLLNRIRAIRTDRRPGPAPNEVALWLDPDTGMPEQIVLRRHESDEGPGRRPGPGGGPRHGGPGRDGPGIPQVTLRRIDSPDLPAEWFEPAHHASD